jgi:transglutaminase-like putative cysteine protease
MKIKAILLAMGFLLMADMALADHSGLVTYKIDLKVERDAKVARLWLPYPLSGAHQTISNLEINGNYNESGVYRDATSGATFLYAGWDRISAQPFVVMSFQVATKDRRVKNIKASDAPIPAPIRKYLKATPWDQAGEKEIREIAARATAGKTGIRDKAKAVYDWVIEHTFRDPAVKACGLGNPMTTLFQSGGGGKCADISSVYVAIARAAGVPARDVFGLRLAHPKDGDITDAFHCWAEFYLPGTGWVPVDPADVRKMMLVHHLELKDAGEWRKFFWGGDDLFRVVLEKDARGVIFEPRQKGQPVNYFMYPFAQVDGKALDYFDAKNFSYSVSFQSN